MVSFSPLYSFIYFLISLLIMSTQRQSIKNHCFITFKYRKLFHKRGWYINRTYSLVYGIPLQRLIIFFKKQVGTRWNWETERRKHFQWFSLVRTSLSYLLHVFISQIILSLFSFHERGTCASGDIFDRNRVALQTLNIVIKRQVGKSCCPLFQQAVGSEFYTRKLTDI